VGANKQGGEVARTTLAGVEELEEVAHTCGLTQRAAGTATGKEGGDGIGQGGRVEGRTLLKSTAGGGVQTHVPTPGSY